MVEGGGSRFPATMRLKTRSDFTRVYREGAKAEGRLLLLHVLPTDGLPRIGIVLPRQWGTAVERNKMKRLLREAFRREVERFFGTEMIVRPQPASRGCALEEISEDLLEAHGVAVRRGGAR